MSLQFEWDAKKAKINLAKHGVSFEEAATIFGDPLSLTISDEGHSAQEDRFITLGQSLRRRVLVAVYTERADKIRVISARKATKRELKAYEEK